MADWEDYGSRWLSYESCEEIASDIRKRMECKGEEAVPPICSALNRLQVDIVVRSKGEMDDTLAFAVPRDMEIHVREDVALASLDDDPPARFTLLHEVAHLFEHRQQDRFFRKGSGNQRFAFLRDDESVEGQADLIAAAIAMPEGMVAACKTARELAVVAKVPLEFAFTRFNLVQSRKRRSLSAGQRVALAQLRASSAPNPTARRREEQELLKAQLWLKLPEILDEHPADFRLCGPYRIAWAEYGLTTQCGWFVENGTIVSFFASRHL